jgi:hypothetical protein
MSHEPTCQRCDRPLADGAWVCDRCTARIRVDLLGDDRRDDRPGIVDTAAAARDIAMGLSRRGGAGGSGKPGSRMPLDLSVTAKLDAVQGELTTWARHVAEERSGWYVLPRDGDPIIQAAHHLAANLEWMRHRQEADECFTAIAASARILRGIVRGPAEQKYLGPCGAEIEWAPGTMIVTETCDGDVYGYRGADTGTCRTCGARVDQAERAAWLDDEVRQHAYTRSDIADAYAVKENTITVWWMRGKLTAYWVTAAGLHVEWVEPALDPALKGDAKQAREREIRAEVKARGPKVFYLADVLDLAASEAARREEARAKRTRRAAGRETAERGA